MKISYNWLKWYVPEIPEAEKVAGIFGSHLCEVESVEKLSDGDTVLDLNILPNRAHDLLSHHGVARELCGQLGTKFNDPSAMYKVPASKKGVLTIEIQTEKCRRYMGRIVRNIKVGPSPEWVVKHLESIGQRSINNIVDATNICMFDCGQPMHAFDLKKLASEKILIRQAQDGETMKTLDGKDVVTKTSDMVIADESGVLALAGVKGGTRAEVDENTTDIVLEVANFDPVSVRKTARRLSIFTDSAKRFENDLSPELGNFGMMELTGLIVEMCPEGIFEDVVDVYPAPQESRKISFKLSDVNKKLGANISSDEAETILKNYSYIFTKEGDTYTIDVPPLRLDLTGTHDITEELGRIYGYEKISPELPKINFSPKKNDVYARIRAVRAKLFADGYSEVMTYTFTKKGKVEIARGAKGKEFLRTNLSDGMKEAYEHNRLNAPLLGADEVKIFEIGTVFPSVDGQEMHVAYVNKKGVVESTLEEFTRDMDLEAELPHKKSAPMMFTPWSSFPFITRDIAVWVGEGTSADELIQLCKENGTELLVRDPELFDQFTKEGKTSLAVRLVFQAFDRTLTDEEITRIMEKITQEVQKRGWQVR